MGSGGNRLTFCRGVDALLFATMQWDARPISSILERWMRFASASKANKEKTMKTMMKKLWRLGIVFLVAVNLL